MITIINENEILNPLNNSTPEPADETAEVSETEAIAELKKGLARREKELAQKENDLNIREAALKQTIEETEIRISYAAEKEVSAQLDRVKADSMLKAAQETAENQKKYSETLAQRETAIKNAELTLEQNLAARRREFEEKLLEKEKTENEKLENQRAEFMRQREQMLSEAEKECEKLCADAAVEMSKWRTRELGEYKAALEDERKAHVQATDGRLSEIKASLFALTKQQDEFAEQKQRFEEEKSALEEQKSELAFEQKQISIIKKRIAETETRLDDLAEEKAQNIISDIISEKAALEDQCERLREAIQNLKAENEAFASLKITLGGNPAVIQKSIGEDKKRIAELEDKLANAPSKELETNYDNLKRRVEELLRQKSEAEKRNGELSDTLVEVSSLEAQIRLKDQTIEDLNKMIEHCKQENESLHESIKRLSSAAMQAAERNDRLRALFDLHSTQVPFIESEEHQPKNEIEWLEGIQKNCEKLQIAFPKRILYAFHTALKIADWSTVTVLAGVSGTGKSELPRLYSEFGGINFINVPVQPNWDSQEAMLGYFNSIDNRFDSQPLLRFLVQCTETFDKKDEDMQNLLVELEAVKYRPLNEYMSIVLLDEMNLAHVEHYFADFLSKLESRRGKGRKYVPTIEVKLGAGIKPYDLRLSRNVLWAGTMNQDETTKSLSDKVLDRGIVINFPRPKTLKERNSLVSLDMVKKDSKIPFLEKKTWDSWQYIEIPFVGEQRDELARFKGIVEKINGYLSYVGRAIGHRVWQSIEYYIANYPDVRQALSEAENGSLTDDLKKAMHTAFEDQIVQKIMPKLRGIDTRGDSKKECLDKIRALLEDPGCRFNLSDDFDIACRLGYGQFIWCSANYIDAEDGVVVDDSEE